MRSSNNIRVERTLSVTQTKRTKLPSNFNQSMAVKRMFNPQRKIRAVNLSLLLYTHLTDANILFPAWMGVIAIIQTYTPKSVIVVAQWSGAKNRLRKHELTHKGIIPHVRAMEWRSVCDFVKAIIQRDPKSIVTLNPGQKTMVP